MNPYIYLGGAILAEVIGTTLMKFSEGFTRLWPSVGTIICYCASFCAGVLVINLLSRSTPH